MKSRIRSAVRVISTTCADVREAPASFRRYLICAPLTPIVITRFHSANGAVSGLALLENDVRALLACVALTIAVFSLWFLDRRTWPGRMRVCGAFLRPTADRISEMNVTKNTGPRKLAVVGLMLGLGLAISPANGAGPGAAGADTVRSLYDALLANMRSGPALGAHGRYIRIEPVVRQTFDMQFMTRLAVGPEWERLNDAQRSQVSQAFERYISAIYAERFDSYSGETLRVIGEQPSPGGAIITTEIIKSEGDPIRLNYLLRQNGGTWQIADVYLNGTISELATRRSEFSSIVRTQGIDGLIAVLNTKADTLAARAS
jgi:phospholipid transport system substrate-binding protein